MSGSSGAGSLGTRKVRKIESFSQAAFPKGSTAARKSYVRRNVLAALLNATCASSSSVSR